jgi:hypothetical protein
MSRTGPRKFATGSARGVDGGQSVWTRPSGSTVPSARILMLEVRRPRALPRRLPGPHGALLFTLWDNGAAVPRLPCPRPPAAPLPRVASPPRRNTPNSPERPATPERAPCTLCGHRWRQRRRHRR